MAAPRGSSATNDHDIRGSPSSLANTSKTQARPISLEKLMKELLRLEHPRAVLKRQVWDKVFDDPYRPIGLFRKSDIPASQSEESRRNLRQRSPSIDVSLPIPPVSSRQKRIHSHGHELLEKSSRLSRSPSLTSGRVVFSPIAHCAAMDLRHARAARLGISICANSDWLGDGSALEESYGGDIDLRISRGGFSEYFVAFEKQLKLYSSVPDRVAVLAEPFTIAFTL